MLQMLVIIWRWLLGGTFFVAAWGKWRSGVNITPFPETIYDRMVRGHIWVHWTLIACEVLLGLWLFSGRRKRAASLVTLLLLLGMSVLLVREIVNPDPLGCGCGLQPVFPGRGPEEVRRELIFALIRNVLLVTGTAYVAIMAKGTKVAKGDEPLA